MFNVIVILHDGFPGRTEYKYGPYSTVEIRDGYLYGDEEAIIENINEEGGGCESCYYSFPGWELVHKTLPKKEKGVQWSTYHLKVKIEVEE